MTETLVAPNGRVDWPKTYAQRAKDSGLTIHPLKTEWGTFYATITDAPREGEISGTLWTEQGRAFTINAVDYHLRVSHYTLRMSTRRWDERGRAIDVPAYPDTSISGLTRGTHGDPTPKARQRFEAVIAAAMAKATFFARTAEATVNARELLAQKQEDLSERHVTRATSHLDQAERHIALAARIRAGEKLTDWDVREIGNCSV